MSLTFEAPNLDASNDEGDLYQAEFVFETLSRYAASKARAIHYRQKGEIQRALAFERACESAYKKLPEWARW